MQGIIEFIERWKSSGASERANYQHFLLELCDALEVARPDPSGPDDEANQYVFEKAVTFRHGDGTTSVGRIDLYKRGCFVLEAKQGVDPGHFHVVLPMVGKKPRKTGHGQRGSAQWDHALVAARAQAEQYARALPASEGWPPFLVVVDVGHCIELYADFSLQGKAYVQFPNAQEFRIPIDALAQPSRCAAVRSVWTDPQSLDPSRHHARVTREIASHMALLARSLEAAGHAPQLVAGFLMRCLFTMFAEDVGLIPGACFTGLLERHRGNARHSAASLRMLWESMDKGGFSPLLAATLLRFNGNLFADPEALPLTEEQLALLIEAGSTDWRDVEPAIFGTLLERALDPKERHKLGAHYTPRAYVERLVIPTIIEPLRAEWNDVKVAAVSLAGQGDIDGAISEVGAFHQRLCSVRVLDPACGSGNFLYVTMEHMKRLEGEVLDTLRQLGQGRGLFEDSASKGFSVMPEQFLGIEANPRAAEVARVVLWIGYLQWHFRTRGKTNPPEPVLRTGNNIECRDAVLAWDGDPEVVLDDAGQPVTRWDGESTKPHPVTGEQVPDEDKRIPLYRYRNPRKAEWPKADYIVGNPPFLGKLHTLDALGEFYAEALRACHPEVPAGCDLSMYWWNKAAGLCLWGQARNFGLITTKSISQTFNRRVVQFWLDQGISITFAVPNHPWVDSSDAAAVRIAMTVGTCGRAAGSLQHVVSEKPTSSGEVLIGLDLERGHIHSDLRVGVDLTGSCQLRSNSDLAAMGFILGNRGFVLSEEEAQELRTTDEHHRSLVSPLLNGRDVTDRPRGVFVVDPFGYSEELLRVQAPKVYQRLRDRVWPERQTNRDARVRANWWLFRRTNEKLRAALDGLPRFAVTPETAKHRVFVLVPRQVKPEHKLVVVGLSDVFFMGILSSRVHITWALTTGGRLGVGDDPVYSKSACFDAFPFPDCTEQQKTRIRELGEALDAHRKRQQALHPGLTLTNMYNVLAKLRSGEALTVMEKVTHEQGLCSVLKQIHDDLDAAVFDAYGWPVTLTDEEILERLVALNHERAEEEKRGLVRWLRPEFQAPSGRAAEKPAAELLPVSEAGEDETEAEGAPAPAVPATTKQPWPDAMPAQVQAIRSLLSKSMSAASPESLARSFTGRKASQIRDILETLVILGQARRAEGGYVS
ncbi:MAG: class I SAM-dependent DNA methyltransferase [Deltaproteobacteria bacterium]|nr:class I SAM-dependent DNA methyltransferase [Deltaproteobacteria bacterium]